MDREAKIKLKAEGASRAAGEVREVKKEVSDLAKTATGTQTFLTDLARGAMRLASEAARTANDTRPISFQSAADSAKRFDDQVTRLAIRSQRDIGALRQQFVATGKDIGALPDRVAGAASALTKLTGSNKAADAMDALGREANDTDRSLEEMVGVGAVLFNNLGVPIDKVGDALQRVRNIAMDVENAGGHLALEGSLVRLSPLLAKFQGGVGRAAATIAVLGKGQSAAAAERTAGSVYSSFAAMDPLLVTKKMREVMKDKNYQPYMVNKQGEVVMKTETMQVLQDVIKKAPFGAGLRLMGNDLTALHQLRTTDLKKANATVEHAYNMEQTLKGEGAVDLNNLTRGDRAYLSRFTKRVLGEKPTDQYSSTESGKRTAVDLERSEVELEVGEGTQQMRDRRNIIYKGQRRLQAGWDTMRQALPGVAQDVLEVAETAAVDSAYSRGGPPSAPMSRADRLANDLVQSAGPNRADKVTVDLSTQSMKGIADAIRAAPPVVRTGQPPAAQYTEDAKRDARGAANF